MEAGLGFDSEKVAVVPNAVSAAAVGAVITDLAVAVKKYDDLFDDTPVDKRDFLIPKLLLMQGVSKLVAEEKARAGEIRGSIDQNKIAEKEGSVEIIPFKVFKTWVTLAKKGNEFISQVEMTPENYNKPREEIVDGVEVLNFETLNYYLLLPEEIKQGMFLPYVVSFRSTSYTAGKTLETHRARLQEFGKPLPFKTFKLGSSQKKNDKGTYFVYTISESRNSTDAELEAVKHWNSVIKQGMVKVDHADLEERTSQVPTDTVQAGDQY